MLEGGLSAKHEEITDMQVGGAHQVYTGVVIITPSYCYCLTASCRKKGDS